MLQISKCIQQKQHNFIYRRRLEFKGDIAYFTPNNNTAANGSSQMSNEASMVEHDDVIKWKHFPRNWPFVRGIHRSPVNSPHKGQWRGALMFSLICIWIKDWVNNREAGDLRRYRAHYDVIIMNVVNVILPASGLGSARVNHNDKFCIFGLNKKISQYLPTKALNNSKNT